MNILYVQVPRREIGRAAAEGGGPGRRMFVSVCPCFNATNQMQASVKASLRPYSRCSADDESAALCSAL